MAQPLQHIAAVEILERIAIGQLGYEDRAHPDLYGQLPMRLVDDLQVMFHHRAKIGLQVGLSVVQVGLQCRLQVTDKELCAGGFLSQVACRRPMPRFGYVLAMRDRGAQGLAADRDAGQDPSANSEQLL